MGIDIVAFASVLFKFSFVTVIAGLGQHAIAKTDTCL
jgi:hypothetical protein